MLYYNVVVEFRCIIIAKTLWSGGRGNEKFISSGKLGTISFSFLKLDEAKIIFPFHITLGLIFCK